MPRVCTARGRRGGWHTVVRTMLAPRRAQGEGFTFSGVKMSDKSPQMVFFKNAMKCAPTTGTTPALEWVNEEHTLWPRCFHAAPPAPPGG